MSVLITVFEHRTFLANELIGYRVIVVGGGNVFTFTAGKPKDLLAILRQYRGAERRYVRG